AARRRFELGATTYLESITARSKREQIKLDYLESKKAVSDAITKIKSIIQSQDSLAVFQEPFVRLQKDNIQIMDLEEVAFFQNQIYLSQAERRLEVQKLFPDLSFGYFQGTNSGLNSNLKGYQFGLNIPVFFNGQDAKIKSMRLAEEKAEFQAADIKIKLDSKFNLLRNRLDQLQKELEFYEGEGLNLSREILKTANRSYSSGEIDFYQYIISLENAYEIELKYLDKLNAYNQTIIAINYLTL
ncbi:MAG: TolC family protein, partial [Flavobacteriaceae bacterium]|nr:TolC family protein [Flavobacteriaceae bacterium]